MITPSVIQERISVQKYRRTDTVTHFALQGYPEMLSAVCRKPCDTGVSSCVCFTSKFRCFAVFTFDRGLIGMYEMEMLRAAIV